MKYPKPPLELEAQLDLLIKRGLIVPDHLKAKHYLSHIGYFRLSGYMHFFQLNDGTHRFRPNVQWKDVIDLYSFDRELRLLVLDAIERIEISIRSNLVNRISLEKGSNWYENGTNFWNDGRFNHSIFIEELQARISDGSETFIKHYKSKYTDPQAPPCWMVFELISFGTLSLMYESLKSSEWKNDIALCYKLPSNILTSWLHSLSQVRNVGAHHGRLWNRYFIIRLKVPTRKTYKFLKNDSVNDRKLYLVLCCIQKLLETINPTSSFKTDLKQLLRNYPLVPVCEMGFPEDWETEEIWK